MNIPGATEAVRSLLDAIGEDPARDGLRETPSRSARAWADLTAGYAQDPAALLSVQFETQEPDRTGYDGVVALRDIEFSSLCEHHLLPFTGHAHVAYIPGVDGRVAGISKLARVVDAYARRLQVQERMTTQIAEAIEKNLHARGVIVVVDAVHFCMRMRGVGKQGTSMRTSVVRGVMATKPEARAEALALLSVR